MNIILLAALGSSLAYAAFQRAGVEWSDWNVCLVVLGLTGFVHFLIRRREPVVPLDRPAGIAAAVVLLLVALQLAPLPVGLVRLLSPVRLKLFQAALPFTDGPARTVTLSSVPYETLQYLVTMGGYLLLILLVRELALRLDDHPWRTVWPLLIVGGLEALLGVLQASTGNAEAMATGTYASRDHYAGLLEMILPFAALYPVAILHQDRNRHESPAGPAIKACALLAVAALILSAVVLSLSRMAFLVSLASLFVAASTVLVSRSWPTGYEGRTRWWRKWIPFGIVTATVLLGFIYLPTDPLIQRFSELARTDEVSAATRAQIWRDTKALVKDYPLFGCGMGAYESCFLRYKTVAPMNTVDYAHNDYLQVLAEVGIFGFAAGLFFVGRLLQKTGRNIFHAASSDERFLAIACLSSLTAMLLHSLVDFNMYVPANAMVFAWVAGIAAVNLRRASKPSRRETAKTTAIPVSVPQ